MEGLTGTELTIALVAWILVAALAALVLLLYQQLDRAYGASSMAGAAPLEPGAPVPSLEVVSIERGLHEADLASLGPTFTVTFVTGSCSTCIRLLRELIHAGDLPADDTVVAVSHGSLPQVLLDGLGAARIHLLGVGDASAVTRDWGVTEVPTSFAFAEGRLVATGPTRSLAELWQLAESDAVAVP